MVQLALGPSLLVDADDDVHQHQASRNDRVVHLSQQDQEDADGKEDGVDKGESVLAKDLEVGAARLELDRVPQSLRPPGNDFAL